MESITLTDAVKRIVAPWSPLELARFNDHAVILATFEGEYPGGFHSHKYDELFFVHSGEIVIQMNDRPSLVLKAGEIGVVPKGVDHCPKSAGTSSVIMFEPIG